ncbi:hypothetical protein LX32DRAFT_380111 [Colletotrichum zoysiae]|uniref:Uncharacterized protein n=1 Tax=Colletotrichum zoysiae TaxID=1216348 RepID=A0AAD9M4R0_9PEZI|nr:hypothetical protein LX32DRAFT_380111 [Colletotrichum zoysiae]
MRRGLLLAVVALSTNTQGAVVDKRQNIQIDGNGKVNVQGPGAAGVKVTTLDAAAVLGKGGNAGSGQGNIIADILGALEGNRNGANGANCPPPAAPVTVTKTVFQNASMPAPLTVFVTQPAAAPQIITQLVTTTMPAAAPPPAAAAPSVPAAAEPAPAAPSSSRAGLVIPGPPQPPPFAGLLSSSSIPPPAAATPAPVAAEPAASKPAASKPAAPAVPAVSNPPAAALPQVGGPAGNSSPTKSLNLGGLTGSAAAQPATDVTPPVAVNPVQPPVAVSGLALSKSLQLGNLLQQTARLQARETAAL